MCRHDSGMVAHMHWSAPCGCTVAGKSGIASVAIVFGPKWETGEEERKTRESLKLKLGIWRLVQGRVRVGEGQGQGQAVRVDTALLNLMNLNLNLDLNITDRRLTSLFRPIFSSALFRVYHNPTFFLVHQPTC